MNTYLYIFSLFAILAFVLSIFFFLKRKGDKLANRLLGIYVLLFSFNIFYNILYWSRDLYTQDFVALLFTNILVWVSYGPILYFYVRRVVLKKGLSLIDSLHFIPFLLIAVNYGKGFFMAPAAKMELIQSGRTAELILLIWPHLAKVIIALMLFYFVLIFFQLRNAVVSRNQNIWLKLLAFSFLGYALSFASYWILSSLEGFQIQHDYYIGYSMIFFISLLAYFGFMQPEVFNGLSVEKLLPIKYKTTGLSAHFSLELKAKVLEYMADYKPYLNHDFRLEDMANSLNLSRHHTSQVINEQFDANFFNFINSYRIEDAKALLASDLTLNASEVMYSCGFNNRVSFYAAFKKFTGITPKQYQDQVINNLMLADK